MKLTLRFMPYSEIENLSSARRIHKILEIVKQNKIVVLEGRLTKQEEMDLIKITMESIDKKFKGVELAVIEPKKEYSGFEKIKKGIINALLGNRIGLTVIGPASIIKEIKKDPTKIELLTRTKKKR